MAVNDTGFCIGQRVRVKCYLPTEGLAFPAVLVGHFGKIEHINITPEFTYIHTRILMGPNGGPPHPDVIKDLAYHDPEVWLLKPEELEATD
jgi:hypothetical protein